MVVTARIIDQFESFGRCLALENGHVEAYVTIDVGPRVIRLGKPGGANLFFTDPAGQAVESGSVLKETYGPDAVYRFYGGHRLWMSPEDIATTYAPDNDLVTVTTLPDGALFTPPPQGRNGLQFSMQLKLAVDRAEVTVAHVIENIGSAPVTMAPWAITQMRPGGVAIIPQSKRDTGLLADRQMAVWPYTDMGDKRVTWADNVTLLRAETDLARAFKIGLFNLEGWGAYVVEDTAFIKMFEARPGETYPDGGMNFEAYTDYRFIELETLGALQTLPPGDHITHTELWRLTDAPNDWDRNNPEAALAFAQSRL